VFVETPGLGHRGSDLNSFFYLPAAFTTLFVLAASLLLGLL
jgi:hypothetical protein